VFRVLLVALVFASSACRGADAAAAISTVFYAHDERAITGFEENAAVTKPMVDALVIAVTGQRDIASAWRSLVQPKDRVGIKISASGGRVFSTHKGVVRAIATGLSQAGVPPQNIIVWDRADMAEAGFNKGSGAYLVRSVEPFSGYDLKAVVSAPMEGKLIWGDGLFLRRNPGETGRDQFSNESHWSTILEGVTKIINVPVFSSSEDCGIAGCLYNVTVPNLDNWRRFLQTSNPYLCDLYRDENVAPKVVLNVLDSLIAQYAGGPEGQPNYAWRHATIYASKDPVALDATALREIEKWRADAKLPSLAKHAAYLQTAEEMGIGNFAAERIELKPVSIR
jgi:uncharacterized protein (DUF362 family)